MDRTRPAVESETPPVPHLEREDVGRRGNLQHHAVRAGTVDRAAGNEEMVVLLRGKGVDVPERVEGTRLLARTERVGELLARDAGLLAEIDDWRRGRVGVEQVVTLVLRVVHSEYVLDVFRERMALER